MPGFTCNDPGCDLPATHVLPLPVGAPEPDEVLHLCAQAASLAEATVVGSAVRDIVEYYAEQYERARSAYQPKD